MLLLRGSTQVPGEGTGFESREAVHTARGFKSLLLRHPKMYMNDTFLNYIKIIKSEGDILIGHFMADGCPFFIFITL